MARRPAVDPTQLTEEPDMPFYFFFGVLGLVIGGLVSWFFMADHPFETPETPGGPVDALEAAFLSGQLEAEGTPVDEETITRLLELHGAYVTGYTRDQEVAAIATPDLE